MKRKLNFGRLESKLLVILAFLFCWIFLQSCNKDSSVSDSVTLSVKLIGVSSDDQSLGDNGVAKTASVYAYQTVSQINDVQFASSPFSDRYDFNLTVAKDQFAEIAGKETLSLLGKNVSTNLAATLSPLGTNVHYRMVIYKHDNPSSSSSDATYVADYEYTVVGPVGGNPSFYLNDGEYYTFIFYSTNQSTQTPSINTSQKLNSATLPNLVGDQNFMYQRITRLLSKGDNVLEVELVHKFTEVTINLDASDISGTIESIGTITLPHYTQANASLSTGAISYVGAATTKVIPFTVASNKITATTGSVKICHPTITSLSIPSMRIVSQTSDKTATPAAITGIAINPGMKYTLNGAIERKPIVVGTTSWAPANLMYNGASTTKKYYFAAAQNSSSTYWNPYTLVPTTSNAANPKYSEANRSLYFGDDTWRELDFT